MTFLVQSAVLASLVALSFAGKPKEDFHKECATESKIQDSYFEKANNGEFIDDQIFNNFLVCLARKSGFIIESYDLSIDIAHKSLLAKIKDENKVKDILKKCAVQADTAANTAYQFNSCVFANSDFKFSEFLDEDTEHHKECMNISRVEYSVIEKAKNNDFVNDEKFKQYLLCGFKKSGLINEYFGLANEATEKLISSKIKDKSKVQNILQKCNIKYETIAKTVFNNTKCIFQNVPDIKFVYK